MKITRYIALALVVLTASACLGPKLPPNALPLNPIAKTAVYGRQFVIAGNGALKGIDSVMSTGVLPREYGLPVLGVMKQVGDYAVKLADVLLLVDQAKSIAERDLAIDKAKETVNLMKQLLDNAAVPIPDSKAKSVVSSALATLSAILGDFGDTITSLIGGGRLAQVSDDLRTIPYQWATSPLLYTSR